MLTKAENKHLSVHFFFHGPRPFHPSTEESTGPIRRKCTSSGYSRDDAKNNNTNKRSKKFSINRN